MAQKLPADPRIVAARCGEGVQHLARAVHGSVVNDYYFNSGNVLIGFEHTQSRERLSDEVPLVVNRDQHDSET